MSRRRSGLLAALVAAVTVTTTSCGLPSGGVRSVDGEEVPYNLLVDDPTPSDDASPTAGATWRGPVAFWVNDSGMLVPRSVGDTCPEVVASYVDQVLAALRAGPDEGSRADGLSTALPPDAVVTRRGLEDGELQLDLATPSAIGADRLPVALAQVVLTVTVAPGVDRVALVSDGEALQVPVADGALTTEPVTATAYADLVPARYLDAPPFAPDDSTRPACPGR